MAEQSYVEQREGVYWVTGTRVSLDSIVYAFLDGHTACVRCAAVSLPSIFKPQKRPAWSVGVLFYKG